jgi:hypothetical protein
MTSIVDDHKEIKVRNVSGEIYLSTTIIAQFFLAVAFVFTFAFRGEEIGYKVL